MSTTWQVLADAEEVARRAAAHIAAAASDAIARNGHFRLVLAGGSTPEATYRLLAGLQQAWARWEIWFGDERCLPPADPGRNSRMAAQAWLDHVAIPPGQIHPIPAESGAQEGAKRYAQEIANALPFDLVLLGMGEDGHTASLFPGHTHAGDLPVLAVVDSPKPPPERVSLSPDTLADSREVLVLVTGAAKHPAVRAWQAGEQLPVSLVTGRSRNALILLDRAAAGQRAN